MSAAENGQKQKINVFPSITLEELLAGYEQKAFLDEVYQIPPAKPTEYITTEDGNQKIIVDEPTSEISKSVFSVLNEYLGTNFDDTALHIVSENIENIFQHCIELGRKARVLFYSSPSKNRFIGLFQLDSPCGFGSQEIGEYLTILKSTVKMVETGKGYDPHKAMDSDFAFGTYLSLASGNISRIGFAEVDEEPFYFFEYNL